MHRAFAVADFKQRCHHDSDLVVQEAVAAKFKDDFVVFLVFSDGCLINRANVIFRLAAGSNKT